jgi:lia operon protein LiaG
MQVFRLTVPVVALCALLAGPRPAAAGAQQAERHTVTGDDVAIYDLAGVVRVEGGSGSAVIVELRRGGRDAARLRVEQGALRGRETLRVIFPDDDVVYRELGGGSNTTLDVRDDGTFGDGDGKRVFGGRHRVRISGSGEGLEAHADLRIAVPAGKRVAVYLGVGQAFVTNVNGDLRVDVASADVAADHTKGSLYVDTGSGDVRVGEAEGDLTLDTGSGNVIVSGARGGTVKLDTGSGNVTAERITADVLNVDTGSGDVVASGITSRDVTIDTGSGGVRLGLLTDIESLNVDTGSGDVTIDVPADFGARVDIETGSGGIELRGVQVRTTRLESDHLTGEIGDGRGQLKVSTGSGGITLQRSGSL